MPAFAANIDLLFREAPKTERIKLAHTSGFRGVEVGCLNQDELASVSAAARRHSVEIVLLNISIGDLAFGGLGYMGIPGLRSVVESEVRRAVQSAYVLGCSRLAVPPSRVPNHLNREACLAALTESLALAADIADPLGIEILLEPLNRIDWPGFLIASTQEALDVIGTAGRSNVGLQLDLYHAAMQGEFVLDSIRQSGSRLRHVQFADCPGRHEPGTGTLALTDAFVLLDALGYEGWAGAEYNPTQTTQLSLSWLRAVGSA